MFNWITCGDDPGIIEGKPATDLLIASWQRLGCPPVEQCLIFEDAINGIIPAKELGMQVRLFF